MPKDLRDKMVRVRNENKDILVEARGQKELNYAALRSGQSGAGSGTPVI